MSKLNLKAKVSFYEGLGIMSPYMFDNPVDNNDSLHPQLPI